MCDNYLVLTLPKSDTRTFVLPVKQNKKKYGEVTLMGTNIIRE